MAIRSTFPDVSANLYGLLMRVTFLNYLHGEKNYPSLEALKAGIDDDVVKLLEFRQNTPHFPLNTNQFYVKRVSRAAD